jgi:hypothetical protein
MSNFGNTDLIKKLQREARIAEAEADTELEKEYTVKVWYTEVIEKRAYVKVKAKTQDELDEIVFTELQNDKAYSIEYTSYDLSIDKQKVTDVTFEAAPKDTTTLDMFQETNDPNNQRASSAK